MATGLPKAERGIEMQATRVSAEPPSELGLPASRRPYGPGDVIDGKYELESLLGKGGMGEVWTARNNTLDVRRAVKLIRADAGTAESTDRLLYEAQAAARLAEPAIVRVFDFGKTSWGDPYIVMEMLEGEDLMSVIRDRERLSPSKAVRVLLPVIRALCAAHAHGIVHRDLKPENIFLAKLPDGRVQPKLLDFGIAKLKNARALRLTTAGAVMGSPLYMAPEQARGEDVDERADVWAICVVLYEAVAGSPPFSGESRTEVIRVASEASPPPLREHGVEDEALWRLLARGLEKQPAARWASMEELGKALARWLLESGSFDDISGASLQATWFRSSHQSVLASSTPPERSSLASLIPRVALPRGLLARLEPRRWLDRRGPVLASLAARWADARARRRGALVLIALGALGALGALAAGESASAGPPPAPPVVSSANPATPPRAPSADALPASAPPAPAAAAPAASPEPALGTRAAPPERGDPSQERGATREVPQARRKRSAAGASTGERSKEQRRSKLINPYD